MLSRNQVVPSTIYHIQINLMFVPTTFDDATLPMIVMLKQSLETIALY